MHACFDIERLREERGFTLLETLIALTILALSLTALLQTYSTGLRAAGSLDEHTRARLLAQSVLSEHTASWIRKPAGARGRSGNHIWRVSVGPAEAALVPIKPAKGWQMYHVTVTVSWPPQHMITLETLKLGQVDDEQ